MSGRTCCVCCPAFAERCVFSVYWVVDNKEFNLKFSCRRDKILIVDGKGKRIVKKNVIHKIKHNRDRYLTMVKWIVFSFVMGLFLGVVGAVFYHGIHLVTEFRTTHSWVLLFLPVGAVVITYFYHLLHDDRDKGTNLVISSIQSDDEIPLRVSGLIFVSTILSHLVGASVGREGAALQLGGSVGSYLGRLFHFETTEKKTLIMVGMSAVFSALFGTPIAAAFFSLEVVSVGIMHYSALLPCVIASFTARDVARRLGALAPFYEIGEVPVMNWLLALKIAGLAVCCGLISILFCVLLREGEKLGKKYVKNKYLRAFLLGTILLGLTVIIGDQTYNGAGVDYINACVAGEVKSLGFLIKIIFTVISIVAGDRGGEIVPSFFIGAALGCLYGNLLGFSPAFCAAVGMGTVFCGVTNCPVTSLLISCELFGFSGSPYFLIACAVGYMVSGYYGLYTSQKIVYSKYYSNYIDKKAQ